MLRPSRGTLLISEPFIQDPSFERSVILLVEKNQMGSIGFILNQQLNIKIKDVLHHIALQQTIYKGGPVALDSLHFLYHGSKPIHNSLKVIDGLYWGGDINELTNIIANGDLLPENIRFYLGYSGWDSGQLEAEIEQKTWVVASASVDCVFNLDAKKLWKKTMQSLGGEFALLANSPLDPNLN